MSVGRSPFFYSFPLYFLSVINEVTFIYDRFVLLFLFHSKHDFIPKPHLKYTLDPRLFKDISVYNEQHGDLINQCLNLYLSNYNLKGSSTAVLCESNKDVGTTGKL